MKYVLGTSFTILSETKAVRCVVRANLGRFRLQGLYRKVSGSFSQFIHLEKKLFEAAFTGK